MDRIKAHFVGQFKRSELGMVSHGAFLQSKSLQSIYLSSYQGVRLLLFSILKSAIYNPQRERQRPSYRTSGWKSAAIAYEKN
jgi:hypothetical protein